MCFFLKLTKIKLHKDVCRVGGKFLPQLHPLPAPPYYTKACIISRLLAEISSLSSSVSILNLVSFLILDTFLQ